jgi:uncharacterized protein (TIGR02646 family)
VRYIRGDRLRPSRDWLERAAAAQRAIGAIAARLEGASLDATKTIRRELREEMERHSHLWGEIKPDLEGLSFGKCWYCESNEKRSHLAVDHFRPKSAVTECNAHPGYWWLAFSSDNYRYACTYCNSLLRDEVTGETLGKGTHFPLIDETCRDFCPQDTTQEFPCLLDPVVASDPPLLWFMDDGQATPCYTKERSPLFFQRADTSIRVYSLNQARIADARSMVAFEIKRQIQRGEKYLDDAALGQPAALDHFQEVYRILLHLIGPEAEYSAAARAFLAGYRDKDWVVQALTTA